MGMGDYDEAEHTRREQKSNTVNTDFEDDREEYRGEIEYDVGESTDELLDQFKQLQSD